MRLARGDRGKARSPDGISFRALRDLFFDVNHLPMMIKFRPVLLLLLLVIVAGGLTSVRASAASPGAKAKAMIVITRSEGVIFLGVPATVELNGSKIAGLWRGESFTGSIDPSQAILNVSAWSSPGSANYSFEALPGRSYRFTITPCPTISTNGCGGPFGIAPAAER